MKHRLFNILSVLSLLIGVTAGLLWIRSLLLTDRWQWDRPAISGPAGTTLFHGWSVLLRGGGIRLARGVHEATCPQSDPVWRTNHLRHEMLGPYGFPYPARHPPQSRLICQDRILLSFYGFGLQTYSYHANDSVFRGHELIVTTPLWPIIPAATLVPLWRVRGRYLRLRRQRLVRHGRCPKCSYDLTGNVSGVCPECGTPVPAKETAA